MTKQNAPPKGATRTIDETKKSSAKKFSAGEYNANSSVSTWFSNHKAAFHRALFHLSHNKIASLITILVIASTLALPASFQVVFSNLKDKEENLIQHSGISVFLTQKTPELLLERFKEQLNQKPEIKDISYLSASEALAEFQQSMGLENQFALDTNPIPAVIYLTLNMQDGIENRLDDLKKWLQEQEIVDVVQMDVQWISQLYAIVNLAKNASLLLALFLIFTVMVIIGNTIRLMAQHYRDEIMISKLVGATDAYVRRPYLYSGLVFGFLGGLMACFFVFLGFLLLRPEIDAVISTYGGNIHIHGLNFSDILSILVTGIILGMGAAWIASNRIINEISL